VKYLIRFVTRNAAGGVEHSDKIVDAPAITIGRATDQVLQLRDRRARLQHATIEQKPDGVHISSTAFTGVIVNGRSQRASKLATGDVIEVGANIIKVIDAPDDIDLAITFELSDDASTDHFVTDWSEPASGVGGWSKRRLSWALVGAVAIFAFALPLVVSESFFQAGPIHSAHSTTAAECDLCHVTAFERVPDSTCEACHTVDRHVVQSTAIVLGETRCASCHLEHNEPEQLVNQHQGLCGDCHADTPPDAALGNAGDFLDDHPEFRAIDFDDSSNLIFDHAVHLNENGIVTPDGRRVIECAECHVPEPGSAGFEPIVMDEHCSSCHTLSFDPDDPSRTVPHGDPETVVQSLIEYYSARLLGSDPDAVEQRVRRPGQALSRAERDRAAAEARVEAMNIAEDLFERRACTNCHTVTRVDGEVPWHVEPVQLTTKFFQNAFFTHAAHQTEISACTDCHAATTSESAADSLIPGIENCRDCHGSGFSHRNDPGQTPSTCVMCHSFHFESKGPRE
jgi:pSer/pThr/pTyr-binding forkhead associated (FHA) protein